MTLHDPVPPDLHDPRLDAPRSPNVVTPAPPPGGFRRTMHVAAGPAPGHDYGDGRDVPRLLHGACRDVRVDADGRLVEVAHAHVEADIATDHRLTRLTGHPAPPVELVGQHALPGMRRATSEHVDDPTNPAAAVLLDLGVGGTLAGYARLQAARRSGMAGRDAMSPGAIDVLGDSCRGWALDGVPVALLVRGVNRPPQAPPAVEGDDLDRWHDLGQLPASWMRRRRRIDVAVEGDRLHVAAAFRDSWRDPDGPERSLHEWELDLRIDGAGRIAAADATARSLPFDVCPSVTTNLDGLVGADLAGLRPRTREVLGGVAGCTHLNDLLSTIPAAVLAAEGAGVPR